MFKNEWQSNQNITPIHHFNSNKDAFLFGFNENMPESIHYLSAFDVIIFKCLNQIYILNREMI